MNRSEIVLKGGSANVPLDAVYPNTSSYMGTAQLNGNDTYSITFTPPTSSTSTQTLPVSGIFPPLVVAGKVLAFSGVFDRQGRALATRFHGMLLQLQGALERPDEGDRFPADTAVLSVDAASDSRGVRHGWTEVTESTPLIFGSNATDYGLLPRLRRPAHDRALRPRALTLRPRG